MSSLPVSVSESETGGVVTATATSTTAATVGAVPLTATAATTASTTATTTIVGGKLDDMAQWTVYDYLTRRCAALQREAFACWRSRVRERLHLKEAVAAVEEVEEEIKDLQWNLMEERGMMALVALERLLEANAAPKARLWAAWRSWAIQ